MLAPGVQGVVHELGPFEKAVVVFFDAEVLDVRLDVDEELAAYNRYLAYLNEHGPAKRW